MSTTGAAPTQETKPAPPPAADGAPAALATLPPGERPAPPPPGEPKNAQALRSLEADERAAELPSNGALNGFASGYAFETAQRMANALASSSIVPKAYQGNPANCLIALEAANRLRMSVLAVMQNLDIVHGNPNWRSKFLIATVNSSGKFSRLRWRWVGTEGKDDWGCRSYATDLTDGVELLGPLVTIAIAKAEGWYDRTGSKWKTIPELMLMYRSAGWWNRVYDPEDAMGLGTAEEAEDVGGMAYDARVGDGGMKPVPGAETANQGRRMSLRATAQSPATSTSAPAGEVVDAEVVAKSAETTPTAEATPAARAKPAQKTMTIVMEPEAAAKTPGSTTVVASAQEAAEVAARMSAEREPGSDDVEDAGDVPEHMR